MTDPEGGAGDGFALSRFLPYRVVALGQAMGQSLARQYQDEFDLSIPEWRTLALIGQHDGLTAARVVEETPMDKATVSRAAARLVEKGLALKAPHAGDRRAVTLRLSGAGRAVFAQVSERALAYEAELLASLSEGERASLDALLSKLMTVSSR
jgi:DNA-binding MarR family transcriptional regulator